MAVVLKYSVFYKHLRDCGVPFVEQYFDGVVISFNLFTRRGFPADLLTIPGKVILTVIPPFAERF